MLEYDAQIEHLKKNPHFIKTSWMNAEGIFSLRKNVIPDRNLCLTMMRNRKHFIDVLSTHPIFKEIAADERLPEMPADIKIEHFEIMRDYCIKMDSLGLAIQGPKHV